jgi:hypothetical protein
MRRLVSALSVLAAAAMTLIVTGSAACAHLLAPLAGGAANTTTPVVRHHTGLYGWQTLIVVAAAVLIGMTGTLVARRVRISSRRPAVG